MFKNFSHIILTFILLISVTGISTANMVCKGFSKAKEMSCTDDKDCQTKHDCCEFKNELKKLDIDLSDERESISAPELTFSPVTFFDAVFENKVAMLHFERSELVYKTPLQSRDISVLNQNFRI